jgi:hypothetical protein
MKRNIKLALLSLSAGALVFGVGGCEWFWRMIGDAVGDTMVYNVFLD